jgi:hypothetical protein
MIIGPRNGGPNKTGFNGVTIRDDRNTDAPWVNPNSVLLHLKLAGNIELLDALAQGGPSDAQDL